MAKKIYIVQGGFLPVGASDVTGWCNHLFCAGRKAYEAAVAECEKEAKKNGDYRRRFRVVCTGDCSRKDTYTYVYGFKSNAKTF